MLSVLIILSMVVLLVTLFVGRLSEMAIARIRRKQIDRGRLSTNIENRIAKLETNLKA